MPQAVRRDPKYGRDIAGLEQELTDRLAADPSYQLPRGYSVGEDGKVHRDEQASWMSRHAYLYPLMGAGAGLGGGAAAGTGFFGGGGAAAGGAAGSGGLAGVEGGAFGLSPEASGALGGGFAQGAGPGVAAGSGFSGSGAASTVATGARTASPLLRAGRALAGAAPIVGALTSGNNGQLPPLGTGFQDFLKSNPQFSNLLNNQVGQSNRNDALHKSLVELSMRLLPNSQRGGY